MISVRQVPDALIETRRRAERMMRLPDPNGTEETLMGLAAGELGEGLFRRTNFLTERGEVQMFWVSPDMCALLRNAALQLPPDVRAGDAIKRPVPHGFAVFARPIISWANANQFPIGALSWLGCASPRWDGTTREACGILPFGPAEPSLGFTPASSSYLFPAFTLTDHLENENLVPTEALLDSQDDLQLDSDENRRLVVALLMLLESRIAVDRRTRGNRAESRRAERAGVPTDVRVIELRHPLDRHRDDDDGGYVEWSHRWIVSGHWRNQACGEGHTERRLTWVAPHVKGPEDKPLVIRPTVGALVR